MLGNAFTRTLYFFLFFILGSAFAQQGQLRLEPSSLASSESQLAQLIRDAVQEGGGNLDAQNLHLVIAIKTGFFKDDPVKAEAAREIASKLVNDLTVAGDRVTLNAFEFGLWEFRSLTSSTFTISSSAKDDPNKLGAIADALPKAPKAGSGGGHDLERSVVEIDQSLSGSSDAVIVLLLNSAPSQGAPGETLIGGDDPEFRAVLERWNRVTGTKEGASLAMPYKVILPNGSAVESKLAAVVFAPKTFSGTALSGGSRDELLAGAVTATTPTPPPSIGADFPVWLPILLILGLTGGYFAYRAFSGAGASGSAWMLTIDGGNPDQFALAGVTAGRTLVELVGANYQSSSGDASAQIRKAPEATAVARFVRIPSGLRLEGMNGFEVKELNSDAHSGAAQIKIGGLESHDAVIGGSVLNSNGVAREVNISVSFRLSKNGS